MPDPWRSRKKCSPARPAFASRGKPQSRPMGFSRITKHESRNTAFFRPGLRSMRIMVREMSLIRGLGAPAKEMSFRHHLALFKDHSCPPLPTIARHCPPLPAKKMLQARVASQYGRGSRGPGRVPRAAPRQPGCTVEQTNHEPRSFLARGASQAEEQGASRLARAGVFAKSPPSPLGSRNTASPVHRPSDVSSGANQAPSHGFHESRDTKHESRPFFACFDRRVVRHAGWCPAPPGRCFPARCGAAWRGYRAAWAGGSGGVSQCRCTVSRSRSALRQAPPPGSRRAGFET